MKLTPTAIAIEMAVVIVALVIVEWVTTVFLHTNAFWPLMIYAAVSLAIRLAMLARSA